MKTPIVIITMLLLFTTNSLCAQKENSNHPTAYEAAAFNDKIIDQTDAFIFAYNAFIKTWQDYEFGDPDLSLLQKDFKILQERIKTSLDSLALLEKFDGKNEFKNAAIKYIHSYLSLVNHEWMKIMKLLKKGKEIKQNDIEKCEKIALKIDKKIAAADTKFFDFQKTFAKKYGFRLV